MDMRVDDLPSRKELKLLAARAGHEVLFEECEQGLRECTQEWVERIAIGTLAAAQHEHTMGVRAHHVQEAIRCILRSIFEPIGIVHGAFEEKGSSGRLDVRGDKYVITDEKYNPGEEDQDDEDEENDSSDAEEREEEGSSSSSEDVDEPSDDAALLCDEVFDGYAEQWRAAEDEHHAGRETPPHLAGDQNNESEDSTDSTVGILRTFSPLRVWMPTLGTADAGPQAETVDDSGANTYVYTHSPAIKPGTIYSLLQRFMETSESGVFDVSLEALHTLHIWLEKNLYTSLCLHDLSKPVNLITCDYANMNLPLGVVNLIYHYSQRVAGLKERTRSSSESESQESAYSVCARDLNALQDQQDEQGEEIPNSETSVAEVGIPLHASPESTRGPKEAEKENRSPQTARIVKRKMLLAHDTRGLSPIEFDTPTQRLKARKADHSNVSDRELDVTQDMYSSSTPAHAPLLPVLVRAREATEALCEALERLNGSGENTADAATLRAEEFKQKWLASEARVQALQTKLSAVETLAAQLRAVCSHPAE